MPAIDEQVEALVRETLAGIAAKDPERLQRAVSAFPSDESVTTGIRLAVAVSLVVLHDVQEGAPPTSEELAEFADDIAKAEADWTDITSEEILKLLTAAYNKVELSEVLPLERVIVLVYVIAANLLGSYRDDNEPWWDYLDRIEAVIEAAPDA